MNFSIFFYFSRFPHISQRSIFFIDLIFWPYVTTKISSAEDREREGEGEREGEVEWDGGREEEGEGEGEIEGEQQGKGERKGIREGGR